MIGQRIKKFENDRTKDNGYKKYSKKEFQQSVFHCCGIVQCPNCYYLLSGILAIICSVGF